MYSYNIWIASMSEYISYIVQHGRRYIDERARLSILSTSLDCETESTAAN